MLRPVTAASPVSVRQTIPPLILTLVGMVAVGSAAHKVSYKRLTTLRRRSEMLDMLLRTRERPPQRDGHEPQPLSRRPNAILDLLELEGQRPTNNRDRHFVLEAERERIARELHDEIGQRMTGILLQLGRVYDEAPDTVRPRLAQVQDEARAVMVEVDAIAWRMRPGVLDDLGLLGALKALVASLDGCGGPRRIAMLLPKWLPPMTRGAELAIYRIAQESLTNALRHSGATTIAVEMHVRRDELVLSTIDDGCGLPESGRVGPGLRGMYERAGLLGGRLNIQQKRPHGVRVDLTVNNAGLAGGPCQSSCLHES